LPVGLFCAFICWNFLKARETPTRKLAIDRVGLVLLFVWVGALQIMLDKGKDLDWFESTPIVVLGLVSAIAFVAWLIWELNEAHPIVDLSLFKSRNFTLGTLAQCLAYATFFGTVVLMPLWLQTQVSYTATWAGLVAAPSGVVAVLISPLIGRYMGRYDARWFATISFLCFSISYFMRAGFTADSSFAAFVMPMLVQGIAMGMFFVAMLTIVLDRLPPQKIPAASGLNNFLRITGGSFATSIITTYWDRREAFHQSRLVESVTVYDPAYQQSLSQLRGLALDNQGAAAMLMRVVIGQGYLMSTVDLFYFSGWLTLLLIPLCWMTRKPSAGGGTVAAAD
jgi:DHA2 family multidrug resistance protein